MSFFAIFMAKVIIGIHGLGNKPPKDILEKWWKLSIEEGFKKMYNLLGGFNAWKKSSK